MINRASQEGDFQSTYVKWQRLFMRANVVCALIVLATEIGMFFALWKGGLLIQPVPEYLRDFLILPSLTNALLLALSRLLTRIFAGRDRVQRYVPVLTLALMCLVVASTHFFFAVSLCTFCLPVFSTAIYGDGKMTNRTTALCLLFMLLSVAKGVLVTEPPDPYLVPEAGAALLILAASHIFCTVLIRFQREKSDRLEESYRRQIEMHDQLSRDQKTGLYGDTAFRARLGQAVEQAQSGGEQVALAVLDIDDFKQVNDTCGHARGDQVLMRLAELLRERCTGSCMPARFGGEEFAIIFTGMAGAQAVDLLAQLMRAFEAERFAFYQRAVTLSAGIAFFESGITAEALFDRADAAMYGAKADGKNRLCVYRAQCMERFGETAP